MSEPMGAAGGIDHRMQDHGTEPAGGVTAGQLLRQLRESAGVHVDVLAGTLKVPANKLHALEADQYDAFPDAVFMRALASGVCRTLKADATPVLALLPQSGPVQLVVDKGLNASFKDERTKKLFQSSAFHMNFFLSLSYLSSAALNSFTHPLYNKYGTPTPKIAITPTVLGVKRNVLSTTSRAWPWSSTNWFGFTDVGSAPAIIITLRVLSLSLSLCV